MTTLYLNPEYLERSGQWQRATDLYEGKRDVLRRVEYLWPHQYELNQNDSAKKLRSAREQRSKYMKLPRMVKELLTSFVFRKPPTLDPAAISLLGPAVDNIDGRGTSIQTFLKRDLFGSMLLYGDVNLLVDITGKEAANRAEEQVAGIRPFWEVLNPLSVVDWSEETEDGNRAGKLTFIRNEYTLQPARMRETDAPRTVQMCASRFVEGNRYAVQRYSRDTEAAYKAGNALESPGWVPVGDPIVAKRLEVIPVARICGEPWLDEVCDEAERHYNLRSNRDNILYFQGYQKIFVIGENSEEEKKAMAEYLLAFAADGTQIQVIEPADLTGYNGAIEEALNNAFKVGLLQLRALPSDSRASQSSDTMSEEKDNAFARVEAAIEDMETAANEALEYHAAMSGSSTTGQIKFVRDLNEENFQEVIQIYEAFVDEFRKLPVVTKEILKKAVQKMNLSPEALKIAEGAINEMPDEPEEPKAVQVAMPGQTFSEDMSNGGSDAQSQTEGE